MCVRATASIGAGVCVCDTVFLYRFSPCSVCAHHIPRPSRLRRHRGVSRHQVYSPALYVCVRHIPACRPFQCMRMTDDEPTLRADFPGITFTIRYWIRRRRAPTRRLRILYATSSSSANICFVGFSGAGLMKRQQSRQQQEPHN